MDKYAFDIEIGDVILINDNPVLVLSIRVDYPDVIINHHYVLNGFEVVVVKKKVPTAVQVVGNYIVKTFGGDNND